ncbi:MAG TPA: cupin domain-containing protein [Acidimicrobiia bacterium]|nr:cupin domain-containing protein [Acidimicrobiia bacterium]
MTDIQKAADLYERLEGIGDRLREERTKAGISQRELARRTGLSASLISQLEGGQSKPSVGTLYAIVTELNVSLDRVIRGDDYDQGPRAAREGNGAASPLVHPDDRQAIELDSGVRWEELSATSEHGVDFLLAIYEVGGASTADESLMRHHGREYGYVISGTLGIRIGFQEYELHPGDSIAFDSTQPHRLFNKGQTPVQAVWFVVGRDGEGPARPV